MDIEVLIEQDKNNQFYKIIIYTRTPKERSKIYSLDGIIAYFKIPKDYLINNLLQLNGFVKQEKYYTNNKIHYLHTMYFKNEQDAKLAKQWFENNLDGFLVANALIEEN